MVQNQLWYKKKCTYKN